MRCSDLNIGESSAVGDICADSYKKKETIKSQIEGEHDPLIDIHEKILFRVTLAHGRRRIEPFRTGFYHIPWSLWHLQSLVQPLRH